MKRTLVTTCTLIALICSAAPAEAAYEAQSIVPEGLEITGYDTNKDYMAMMLQCAEEGSKNSLTLGAIYEAQRNMKITMVGADYGQTDFFNSFDAEEIKKELDEYNNPATDGPEDNEPDKAPVMYYTDDDAVMLAKLLHIECGSVYSDTEKACVVWTVLNRADRYGQSIYDTITSPGQFAYYSGTPVRNDLYNLAHDVLSRWNMEKNGQSDVGRVLPLDYMWFYGDGSHNYFRNAYSSGYSTWDYSLPSPYES